MRSFPTERLERATGVSRRSVLITAAGTGGVGGAGCLGSDGDGAIGEPTVGSDRPQRDTPDGDGVEWATPNMSTVEINDTIEAAQEAGKTVAFAPGTYELAKDDRLDLQNPAAIRCRDGVNLVAPYGNVTLERVDTMHNMIYAGFDPDTNEPHASNFRIEGFDIVGNKQDQDDPDDSHISSGIMLYGFAENVTIANNHVQGWHGHGIHADVTSNSRIVDNTIRDCNIGIHPSTRNGRGPNHTTIAHNTIRDCLRNGLDGGENDFCAYVGNTIENCPGGCNLSGSNNVVVGNTLRGSGDGIGIHFRKGSYSDNPAAKYNVATGNTVENFRTGARLRDSHCVVATNTFRDIHNRVVWVEEGAHQTRISDVRADGPGYGILVQQANHVTIENVRITGSRAGDVAITEGSNGTNLRNTRIEEIQDEGSRTMVGGAASNDGDPSREGEWNGYADLARQLGVTVWDVSGDRATLHRVDPTGEWQQIA